MNNSNPASEETLRKELGALGAREFEIVALTMDVDRGLAALRYAVSRGVDHPIPYAIACFDNDERIPTGAKKRKPTNVSVEVKCSHCGGDRFVVVTDGPGPYEETYAPCAQCNPRADTHRFVVHERYETAPR